MAARKLNASEKRLLVLIDKGSNSFGGWSQVSDMMKTHVLSLPEELVDVNKVGKSTFARLTPQGEAVVNAMNWL